MFKHQEILKMQKILFSLFMIAFMFVGINAQDVDPDKRGYIVKVGDKAADFELVLANEEGTKVTLEDMKGKVIMLQFTASWCGVCRKEMPFIEEEIWQLHKDKDFVLIGVDRDEPLEKVQQLAEQTGVTYPLALDPGAEVFQLFATKKSGVTRNVIINPEGEIVYLTRLFEREEFDEMKEVINELIEENEKGKNGKKSKKKKLKKGKKAKKHNKS